MAFIGIDIGSSFIKGSLLDLDRSGFGARPSYCPFHRHYRDFLRAIERLTRATLWMQCAA